MNPISVTLNFSTMEEAVQVLTAVNGARWISSADRPDVGAEAKPLPTAAQLAFGGAAALAHPPAPSTAGAEAAPIAPVAPTGTFPLPPSAATPPALPPVSEAAAPAAPAGPSNPAKLEVDVDGLPWDARIHASSKDGPGKNADGRWRQRRGLNDPALKARVEAELRQAMAAGIPAAPIPQPPVTQPPAPPLPPVVAAPAQTENFATIMVKVSQAKTAGKLTDETYLQILQQFQLSAPGQLLTRPDLIPHVGTMVDQVIAAAA